jgi:hypothetical protein
LTLNSFQPPPVYWTHHSEYRSVFESNWTDPIVLLGEDNSFYQTFRLVSTLFRLTTVSLMPHTMPSCKMEVCMKSCSRTIFRFHQLHQVIVSPPNLVCRPSR